MMWRISRSNSIIRWQDYRVSAFGLAESNFRYAQGHIRRKNLPEVRLAEDQHPVQALATHGTNQTLYIRILPRRSRRDRSVADAHRPHPGREDMSVGTVVVPHQVGGS